MKKIILFSNSEIVPTAYSLEHYSAVKKWENGYLVVMAKYRHNKTDEEEYIDLVPILENLYIDADNFLKQIKEVRIYNG